MAAGKGGRRKSARNRGMAPEGETAGAVSLRQTGDGSEWRVRFVFVVSAIPAIHRFFIPFSGAPPVLE
ncbi:hypothetical protein GCM10009754_21260 [Amycolatopsis minnesotensis]|uniref:Uncharacterized protein n=1 Tax=Amycolatopsis minnesotensis TaxID=337894 RepID=A0ABN2QHJ4_9PSEU